MKIAMEQLEEYVEGMLPAKEAEALEEALRTDAALSARVATIKLHRALRQAALGSYQPGQAEAKQMAARCMELLNEAHAVPAGKIHQHGMSVTPMWRFDTWLRAGSAVAAGLLVAAGSFWAGRYSHGNAPVGTPLAGLTHNQPSGYEVNVTDASGNIIAHSEFKSLEDANAMARMYATYGQSEQVADALDPQGQF